MVYSTNRNTISEGKTMIPREEYPRPQLERKDWINLNGCWEFTIDYQCSGEEKEYEKIHFENKITVPFCPESELSGIKEKDFLNCVWYRKDFRIPKEWEGKKIILHFGAVDYYTKVYINGILAGEHKGGYTPFSFDITEQLKNEGNYVTLCAYDDNRTEKQPAGKQSRRLNSYGCYYTRTTGIWQTVWLECVNENYINNLKITTDINKPCAYIEVDLPIVSNEYQVYIKVFNKDSFMGEAKADCIGKKAYLSIDLKEKHLWDIGNGNLYDIEISLTKDNNITDFATSYFGLRSVFLKDGAFYLNNRKVFLRTVLDQGFYPDGIYTARDKKLLEDDIDYAMKLGFNGARLHEKVFEPYYLYQADKKGFLVFGEYANWCFNHSDPSGIYTYLPEWLESVKRDFNHPSIIGWCPFNETSDYQKKFPQCDDLIKTVYEMTKEVDPTRPVIDTSGWFHVKTDIYDVHDYLQDPEEFYKSFSDADKGILRDAMYRAYGTARQKHNGEPIFVSEYGGIKWDIEKNQDSWGYGNAPKSEEEFIDRYKKLTDILLDNENIMGFCYTQLYDVEQEKNGLMTYDRQFKFNPEIFYKINTRKAKIEE